MSKQAFLVVYDYGQGGVWAWIRADSAKSILGRYPELKVINEPPEWLTSAGTPSLPEHDLEAPPAGLLADVIAGRPNGHGAASRRRQVAEWAEQYLAGDLPFDRFLSLVPEDAEDALITELIDLVEHEPKRGGLLGATPAKHDGHVRRMRDLIAALRGS